jgi:uncharacterized membrane protein
MLFRKRATIIVVYFISVLILLAVVLLFWFKRRGSANADQQQSKVIHMNSYRKKPAGAQKCSYCKKKANKLTFYADPHGTVIGVCKQCRLKAEQKELMPL